MGIHVQNFYNQITILICVEKLLFFRKTSSIFCYSYLVDEPGNCKWRCFWRCSCHEDTDPKFEGNGRLWLPNNSSWEIICIMTKAIARSTLDSALQFFPLLWSECQLFLFISYMIRELWCCFALLIVSHKVRNCCSCCMVSVFVQQFPWELSCFKSFDFVAIS